MVNSGGDEFYGASPHALECIRRRSGFPLFEPHIQLPNLFSIGPLEGAGVDARGLQQVERGEVAQAPLPAKRLGGPAQLQESQDTGAPVLGPFGPSPGGRQSVPTSKSTRNSIVAAPGPEPGRVQRREVM